MTAAAHVLAAARRRGVVIATAESCTGGLIIGALTDVAGSSDVVDRGFVTYSNAAKAEMLGVPANLISEHGAVSEEVARAMADGALAASDAGLTVAVTGVAGPGASNAKPEGMVWFAVAGLGNTITKLEQFGPMGRSAVRSATVNAALSLLERRLISAA